MENQLDFYKSKGGGQFFKILGNGQVKVVSLYDFNPGIECRRVSDAMLVDLKCTHCTESEFDTAERRAMELLELPEPFSH